MNTTYFCMCARARVRAHRTVGLCTRVRACSLAYPTRMRYIVNIFGPSGSTIFFDII
jgi:hypothetical protein